MAIDISFFNKQKSEISWDPVIEWVKGVGSLRHFIIKGCKKNQGALPVYFLYISINDGTGNISISLYANIKRDPKGRGQQLIETVDVGKENNPQNIANVLLERYGVPEEKSTRLLNDFISNIQSTKDIGIEKEKTPSIGLLKKESLINQNEKRGVDVYLYKISVFSSFNIDPKTSKRIKKIITVWENIYSVFEINEEISTASQHVIHERENVLNPLMANKEFDLIVGKFKERGFKTKKEIQQELFDLARKEVLEVDPEKMMEFYEKNSFKIQMEIEKMLENKAEEERKKEREEEREEEQQTEELGFGDLLNYDDTKQSSSNYTKVAQNNWYTGTLPDPKSLERYVGTPNVDAGQLKSIFFGVDDAVSLVNQFDSSLLRNVAYIFNFSNFGAYGVYLPALDDKIKREKIKSILKDEGCNIEENPDGSFYAFHENKKPEEIQNEINKKYSQLETEGGTIFGINMNKVLMASQSDARELQLSNNEDINDIIKLHLGATIVHEAIHAKGSQSEGPSEASESSFIQWALPKINQKRQERYKSMGIEQSFSPLSIDPSKRRARAKISWLKKAYSFPQGAQFAAEMPELFKDQFALMGSNMMFARPGSSIIETMLQYAREGLSNESQRTMSVEKRMRENEKKQLPNVIIDKDFPHIEDLLEKDRDEFISYDSTEKLLEERRPSPLIIGLDKKKINKVATLFGWYSNLDLQMGERVCPWEQSDELLAFDQDEIKKLPRYNYDGKPYVFYEPRHNAPELWERMIQDRPFMSSPAKRFAQKEEGENDKLPIVILKTIIHSIDNKKILGARIVISKDLIKIIEKLPEWYDKISIYINKSNCKTIKDQEVYSCWIYRYSIPEDKIKMVEDFVCKKNDSKEAQDLCDYICKDSNHTKRKFIDEIINSVKNICKFYSLNDVYIVGGYPRSLVMKESLSGVHDLDFSSAWPDQCLKLGGMLADELDVKITEIFHRTMTLSWEWMGIKCDFRGNFSPVNVRSKLREKNIKTTPLHFDVYSRDFTMNMLIYNVMENKIYDVSKESLKDIKSKVIRTYWDPEFCVENNPIIILRAAKYMARYGEFKLDQELMQAMVKNVDLLFKKYSKERLQIGLQDIFEEEKERANKVIDFLGLNKLIDYIKEN